jgi:hypothetical protein
MMNNNDNDNDNNKNIAIPSYLFVLFSNSFHNLIVAAVVVVISFTLL